MAYSDCSLLDVREEGIVQAGMRCPPNVSNCPKCLGATSKPNSTPPQRVSALLKGSYAVHKDPVSKSSEGKVTLMSESTLWNV